MPQVVVNINGKPYRMACDEGEEARLEGLGARLDSYVTQLKGSFGEIGDQRLTVMAGIMVIDELSESQRKIASLEKELDDLKKLREQEMAGSDESDAAAIRLVKSATQAVNDITMQLKDRAES